MIVAFVAMSSAGCAGPRAGEAVPVASPDRGPVIVRLAPASGPDGPAYPIRVTIEGTGFAAEGNAVTFGSVRVPDLPATEGGTRITFWVPKETPSGGEVPPFVLQPGPYLVTVTTARGTSAPAEFVLHR